MAEASAVARDTIALLRAENRELRALSERLTLRIAALETDMRARPRVHIGELPQRSPGCGTRP